MDQEILKKLEAEDAKLDAIHQSIEKMRKYFLWTLVITIAVIVLPLVGLLLVAPQFIATYTSGLGL